MNIVDSRRLVLAASALLLLGHSAIAVARPGYSTGNSRPHSVNSVVADPIAKRIDDWGYRSRADTVTNSYRAALQFAGCVSRLDETASDRLLATPLGAPSDRSELNRLARQNRACVAEIGLVAPVLIRAALAETAIKATGRGGGHAVAVGIPQRVEGFPLADVARCLRTFAPAQVSRLFATDPGAGDERAVAEALFTSVPACGMTRGLGGIEPTVARLALVDAVYTAR